MSPIDIEGGYEKNMSEMYHFGTDITMAELLRIT